jgi:hypothetical protein
MEIVGLRSTQMRILAKDFFDVEPFVFIGVYLRLHLTFWGRFKTDARDYLKAIETN